MVLFGSWRFSGGAPLVAVAIMLCLGVYLSWSAAGTAVPATTSVGYSSQADQGTSGHPPDCSYLAVTADEAEDGDKNPVNADLLTAFLLTFYFGMAVGSPLAKDRAHEAFCSSGVAHRLSFVPPQDPPSLGVLRL